MPFIQIQLRRGLAADWTLGNPVLAVGEMALESDTNQFKIGDGVSDWVTLPYGGIQGPPGPAKKFTIYLDYSSANAISRVYVPPGLFSGSPLSAGGTFTSDQGTDLVFYGLDQLTLDTTTYEFLVGFHVQGYVTSGEWIPIPGANISQSKVYSSVTQTNKVIFKGLNLGNINGANTSVKPSFGSASGFLATITLFYE
jgi:hypothetical protein